MRQLFVDVGHSDKFPGATGKFAEEYERNVKIAELFKEYASNIGWEIVSIPNEFPSDEYDTSNGNLINRIKWINRHCMDGDWLLSIHTNASADENVRGVTTVYMGGSEYMRRMAESLSKRISLDADLPVVGTGAFDDRKGRYGRIGMVRDTTPPALLVELGFVGNGQDMAIPLATIARSMAEWFDDLNGGWLRDLKI